jgi:hypothetical protein
MLYFIKKALKSLIYFSMTNYTPSPWKFYDVTNYLSFLKHKQDRSVQENITKQQNQAASKHPTSSSNTITNTKQSAKTTTIKHRQQAETKQPSSNQCSNKLSAETSKKQRCQPSTENDSKHQMGRI